MNAWFEDPLDPGVRTGGGRLCAGRGFAAAKRAGRGRHCARRSGHLEPCPSELLPASS